MKKLLILTFLLGAFPLNAQSNLLEYSVFTRSDITYSRSDFEGKVRAGGNISVQDFSFVRGNRFSGIESVGNFEHLSGKNEGSIDAGMALILSRVSHDGALASQTIHLSNSSVYGKVRARDLRVTTSYSGWPSSSHGRYRRMSKNEVVERQLNLANNQNFLEQELDYLSAKCADLEGDQTESISGSVILSARKHLNVFDLPADVIGRAFEIMIVQGSTGTIVINVSGSEVNLENLGLRTNGFDPKKIIWNFHEARKLTIHRTGSPEIYEGRALGFPGTVLAPFAETTFTEAVITGAIFTKNLFGSVPGLNGGQVNDAVFEGLRCERRIPGGKG